MTDDTEPNIRYTAASVTVAGTEVRLDSVRWSDGSTQWDLEVKRPAVRVYFLKSFEEALAAAEALGPFIARWIDASAELDAAHWELSNFARSLYGTQPPLPSANNDEATP